MRVCLETTALRARLTGVGYYVRGLAGALVRDHGDLDLDSFDGIRFQRLSAALEAQGSHADGRGAANFEQTLYDAVRRFKPMRKGLRYLKRARFSAISPSTDVFHALNYMPPAHAVSRAIPTVYDVSHVRHPHAHPAERVDWLTENLAMLDAHPIINTISKFSAAEISDVYGIAPERIRITPPGIDPIFLSKGERKKKITVAGRTLPAGGYLLMVGTLEPRKNHRTVLAAFGALAPALRKAFPLVVVGQYGWGDNSVSKARGLVEEGTLILADYVPQQQLKQLYDHARAFVFPSLYEGFGLPVVEAMACGIPVLASDIPVLREVGGADIDYVEARRTEAWAHALERVASTDHAHVPDRLARARAAGASYSWQSNAAATRAMYAERAAL